jgi:hypothetical protein
MKMPVFRAGRRDFLLSFSHPDQLRVLIEGSACRSDVTRPSTSPRMVGPDCGRDFGDQDMQAGTRSERRQALQEARKAVRAYGRDPSWANADAVEMAWRRVRQLDSLAKWREPKPNAPSRLR